MLQLENTGLIVIDVQGKLARIVHESEKLIQNLEKLIRGCQILSLPIICAEQNPAGLGSTVPELQKLFANQKPIAKFSFNALENNLFKEAIIQSKRKRWIVCGIESHICVYQTVIGLLDASFEVEIAADCISSRTEENKILALNKLQNKGASITSVEMCLYELVKNSKNENFKEILNLIK
ncbi:hydrolase [Flavobacterium hungaricum]|uniref:Hydrolase n=1 Tax=Flavobacterium hungaricum TaxID=2082725 RepID=A0ABR9TSC1_9FLAO|nr:hydrolase [Flavobacterium hungaricum]MBE8728248.1 hydrolase [Flavobacterium hungaricum]